MCGARNCEEVVICCKQATPDCRETMTKIPDDLYIRSLYRNLILQSFFCLSVGAVLKSKVWSSAFGSFFYCYCLILAQLYDFIQYYTEQLISTHCIFMVQEVTMNGFFILPLTKNKESRFTPYYNNMIWTLHPLLTHHGTVLLQKLNIDT